MVLQRTQKIRDNHQENNIMRHQCNFFGVLKYINNRQLYEFIHRHYLFQKWSVFWEQILQKNLELLVTSNSQGQINYNNFLHQMVSNELIINQIVCRRQENLFVESKLLQHGKCWMLYHLQFTFTQDFNHIGCEVLKLWNTMQRISNVPSFS